jgi:CheY-like chemotaxis protein
MSSWLDQHQYQHMNDEMSEMSEASAALSGQRVLVVEDNGLLCCVIEETLREAGCEVIGPFSRLGEAMTAASTAQIDIALLDINLRGELVSPLAKHLQHRGVPYVLTSAYKPTDLPQALQTASQLRKPYTDDDLLAQLAGLVKRKGRNN